MSPASVPPVVAGLCDDAAVFPPGRAPLPDAVRAHREHAVAWYAALVGPLVLPADALPRLGPLLLADEERARSGTLPPPGTQPPSVALPLSVTLPGGPADLPGVLAAASALPVELRSVEVAVPDRTDPDAFLDQLDGATGVTVYVEVPRDPRRAAILAALPGRYRAKFRTGGVRADLHPDEAELAAALAAVVAAGVPFKATAGLHHAVRNTDPATGFEQHGFLNLLLATDALAHGAGEDEARAVLAERSTPAVAAAVRGLDPARAERTRAAFTSFGTCSVTEPLDELVALGIVPESAQAGAPA